MSRFLSESLGIAEPFYGLALRKLEHSLGKPSNDIRLASETQREARAKIAELGLDPHDTTGVELYHSLLERVRSDDAKLIKTLRTLAASHVSAEGEVVAGMAHALRESELPKTSLIIKSSKFKSIIKNHPPKKAMKQLGYRSVESFLKHETPAQVLAAAKICENDTWQKGLIDAYKKLQPTDFEAGHITIAHPNTKRWQALARNSVAKSLHNVSNFPEIGAVVLLPLPKVVPAGVTTASLALAVHALSSMRASNTYLKLSLVRPDFGSVVQAVAAGQPQLQASVLDKNVPWQIVQHYYSRMQHMFREELFEPHIALDDMVWPSVERAMSQIEPALSFWHDSAALGLVFDHSPLSMNIVDAALNLCNQLPFERRLAHYFQQSLWHEVALRYLKHETIETSVLTRLQPQFEFAAVSN